MLLPECMDWHVNACLAGDLKMYQPDIKRGLRESGVIRIGQALVRSESIAKKSSGSQSHILDNLFERQHGEPNNPVLSLAAPIVKTSL